jgi:sugar O-acyltransferase (sialic acid O-acetyltransferase NeuD family)
MHSVATDKPLLIVGTGMLAEQLHFYFETLGGRRVVAFALDAAYLREPQFLGRPVLEFNEALRLHPPATHELFVAIGFTATEARKRKFLAAQALGYTLPSYVHPSACVAPNVRVGSNTLIQERAMVAPFVQLGENVVLCPQVGINHHSHLGSHCFVAPGAVIAGQVEVGELCFIGANATLRDRIHIGEGCVIGAGAVVMADCEAGGTYPAAVTPRR